MEPTGTRPGRTAALVAAALAGPALGQALPAADSLQQEERRIQERSDDLQRRLQRRPDERFAPAPALGAEPLAEGESPCWPIHAIAWQGGAEEISRTSLDAALTGDEGAPSGRCLGPRAFAQLADRAQNHLVAAGYVTTRVLVPPQSVADGTLVLQVLPGRIASIRSRDGSTPPSAAPLQPMAVLQLRAMEQALENLRRVPTAQADIRIEPAGGETGPGWSDVVIGWTQRRQWRAVLTLDDSGSQATGRYQSTATVSVDNPLGANDLAYATLAQDAGGGPPGERGTRGLTFHYSMPRGWWLLGATWSSSRWRQEVAGATQPYLYGGRSESAEWKATRVLRRDADSKASVHLKAFLRTSTSFIDDTEIELQRRRVAGWEAGLAYRVFIGEGSADAAIAARKGTGALGTRDAPEQVIGEGTSRFLLYAADAAIAMPWRWGNVAMRATSQWRAQWNRTALAPQDRFSIGGRYTVRGFDGERTLLSERGWLARNEMALAPGASGHELFAGFDLGRVGGPSAPRLAGRGLAGVVIGGRGAWQAVGGQLSYELFAGRPLRQPDAFGRARASAGFSVAWSWPAAGGGTP
jgi:hemolysin activation/secretion protein